METVKDIIEKSDELENEIESRGIDVMDYEKRNGRYRIKLTEKDLK